MVPAGSRRRLMHGADAHWSHISRRGEQLADPVQKRYAISAVRMTNNGPLIVDDDQRVNAIGELEKTPNVFDSANAGVLTAQRKGSELGSMSCFNWPHHLG